MDSLTAALAAARLGSFSAAALELEITHAAVSRRIAAAEEWAGLRLFDRHGRGVLPTPNGQRILARLALAVEQIAVLGERPHQRRLPVVRLAVTPAFARFWLLPRLRTLEGRPADVRIEVVAELTHADLAGGEVDLAIRYGRGGWKLGPERRLFDELLLPVAGPALLPPGVRRQPQDIAALPLLHSGDTTNWRCWADAHGVRLKPKPADRSFADYALTLEAAAAGLGVALWNQGLHRCDSALTACPEFPVRSPLAYFLLSRAAAPHTPPGLMVQRIDGLLERAGD
jgi:LysR family glycine cleavage system transcriptional activator